VLTATRVRQAKPKTNAYKLVDGGGLYLYVSPKGAKSWRYDFRLAGRRETLVIGQYPDKDLAEARNDHQGARKVVARGESPARAKQADKLAKRGAAEDTFAGNAEEWFKRKAASRSASWRDNARRWLDRDILPAIGRKPIRDVTAADVLTLLRKMESSGIARSAEYARQVIVQVFQYAIQNLRVNVNPAREVKGAIELPPPVRRAPLTIKEIPAFMRAADRYTGRPETKLAIRLLALTFVRKMELVEATWDEIDFDNAQWRIPVERMKADAPHIVPLSSQAMNALIELKKVSGKSRYLFPHLSRLDAPMGASTLNCAFERIGYGGRFTPHGLRATASTILNEQGFRVDVIERQLAHAERNAVRAAYNHADYLDERRSMMQHWADYLDALANGATVHNLRRTA